MTYANGFTPFRSNGNSNTRQWSRFLRQRNNICLRNRAKSDHARLVQCQRQIPPRSARPPLVKGAFFASPLCKRGARGDFTRRDEVYECPVVRCSLLPHAMWFCLSRQRFNRSPFPLLLPRPLQITEELGVRWHHECRIFGKDLFVRLQTTSEGIERWVFAECLRVYR